jgi:16S rRNA (cytosine967-C5)-methyltransferase
MQIASRIQANIELLDTFFETHMPFDIILSKFFKNNKWIGSSDRREISRLAYDIFRCFEKLRFYTKNVTANLGRAYILAFLKKDRSSKNIGEIFSGQKYHPAPLSDFEKHFLRSLDDITDIPNYAKMNYPEWLEKSLHEAFPTDFGKEIFALNQAADVVLRVNTLKTTRDEALRILKSEGVEVEPTQYATNGIKILRGHLSRSSEILQKGLAEIQDEGSQLIAENCDVKNAKCVVDFCAGAGGKTLALSAMMNNKGRIFAMDKYPQRLVNAHLRFRKAGVSNVTCLELSNKWIKRHVEIADFVLVDAPCSGTGTWRRNPDMRAKFSPQDLSELIDLQQEILTTASSLVKPGGKLLYATCSILNEEDEDQITRFLQNNPQFELGKITHCSNKEGMMKLSPYRNQTDGFFAAELVRKQ